MTFVTESAPFPEGTLGIDAYLSRYRSRGDTLIGIEGVGGRETCSAHSIVSLAVVTVGVGAGHAGEGGEVGPKLGGESCG